MRTRTLAVMLAAMGSLALVSLPAAAQQFPSHLKSCKKEQEFERVEATYTVPVVGGGAGVVRVVSQNYRCDNKETRNPTWHPLYGMKDASGKLVVPYAYAKVLPYSTTGALVIDHGKDAYPKNLMYRTYTAGKGEGKERFDFQDVRLLQPNNGCGPTSMDASRASFPAVIGELFFNVGGGKSHVTLFTPEGRARKLEYMGGDSLKPAVRRVGDVLLARWRDGQGVVRSGILDLDGRQIAPVLSSASVWVTPNTRPDAASGSCNANSALDLFIEGPSLDRDPTNTFYGPLLTLVGRDGQPAALPKGAIGMFPAYRRNNGSGYSDAPRDLASMWGVVFPTGDGFEFTLHLGAPSEALIAAETSPRYSALSRTETYGGMVAAKAADGKWRAFRANTDIVVGDLNADLDRAWDSAEAVLAAEQSERQQAAAAAWAKSEAERIATHRKTWEAARAAGRLCYLRVSGGNSREEVEEYILACGPGQFAGLAELARAKGVTETAIQTASDRESQRIAERTRVAAAWEAENRRRHAENVNTNPGASYIPGQWESAIRNAGNVAVDAINQSSDNWLQQRRDQYVADWQRSQRAY